MENRNINVILTLSQSEQTYLEEYAGKVNFFNVDVDENPDLAMQYKIMNIPALVVLKKGEKADTQVGFAPKENIVEFIKKQL